MLLTNKPCFFQVLDGSPGGFLRDAEILCYPFYAGPSLAHDIPTVISEGNLKDCCKKLTLQQSRFLVIRSRSRQSFRACLGQLSTHSMHRMHSVPFFRLRLLSVTSTFIGQTLLHFPQETHFVSSTLTRSRE